MSLRLRTLFAVAFVLFIGSMTGVAVAGWQARQVLREELGAGLLGGRHTVVEAFRSMSALGGQQANLRLVVRVFDGDRHVRATLLDARGNVADRSVPLKARIAPAWFDSAFRFPVRSVSIPAPFNAYRALVLDPVFTGDVGAIWSEFIELTAVLALSLLTASAVIWLTVGRALRPLAAFAPAFLRIGSGDYEARVQEEGPLELVRLGRGVNEMTERLGSMQARNHALELQLTTLQEEERADLARDLHDEIGPHLFAVNVDAAMVRRLIEEGKPEIALRQVRAIEGSVAHMQTLVREILARLRPTDLTELGLVEAIAELVAFWRSRHPAVHFDLCMAPEETLPHALRETIYRIVQEGLNNAVRHGRPHKVTIEVAAPVDDLVIVKIADDGAHAKPAGASGFGLAGMRERVAAVHGHLEINRGGPGKGWLVIARLPILPTADNHRVGAE